MRRQVPCDDDHGVVVLLARPAVLLVGAMETGMFAVDGERGQKQPLRTNGQPRLLILPCQWTESPDSRRLGSRPV